MQLLQYNFEIGIVFDPQLYFDWNVKNICTTLAETSQNFVEVDSYAQGLALGHPSACPCRGAADMWDKPYHLPVLDFQQRTHFIHLP